jgi:SSS family solute:Na+ symporter
MGSSFTLFLAVKFQWIEAKILTLSSVASDMSANFWRAWWAWLICFLVTIIVSLFTARRPESELVGLVKGLTQETLGEHVPLLKRPEFYAVLSLIVLVALNVIFW